MTKRDYQIIADALKRTLPPRECTFSYAQYCDSVDSIAIALQKDNGRFIEKFFYDACGVQI